MKGQAVATGQELVVPLAELGLGLRSESVSAKKHGRRRTSTVGPVAGASPVCQLAEGGTVILRKTARNAAESQGTDGKQRAASTTFVLDAVQRRVATQSAINLRNQWFLPSMNPNPGSAGTCYGDSGGPHFIHSVDPNRLSPSQEMPSARQLT
jgi:hypothetical protein